MNDNSMDIIELTKEFMSRINHPGTKLVLSGCIDELESLRAELAKEREARVKYQSVVYDCCNRLDVAFSRSVRGGEGTTIDQVAPDISFLNRLRLEAIAKAEAAEAQMVVLKTYVDRVSQHECPDWCKWNDPCYICQAKTILQALPDSAAKYQAVVEACELLKDVWADKPVVSTGVLHGVVDQVCEAVRQLKED